MTFLVLKTSNKSGKTTVYGMFTTDSKEDAIDIFNDPDIMNYHQIHDATLELHELSPSPLSMMEFT
jgi:hypothetical protein